MINIYSPTVQSMYGVPPGTMPSYLNIIDNPPVQRQEGFMPQVQQTTYNYGPSIGSSNTYQQQREMAANSLKQELRNPITDYSGNYYNNAPNYGYGSYFYQNQQPTYEVVQGFNPLGVDEIQTLDFEDRLYKLDEFYNNAVEDSRNRYGQSDSYNYYGYYNTWGVDQNITNQYQSAKKQLKEEGKQNRIDLNKRISRAAHTFLGDYDEDWIDQVYDDKKIQINTISQSPEWQEASRMANMVDITAMRVKQIQDAHAEVTKKHNKIVNPNDNIGEFFDQAGMLLWQEAYEKMELRNRNRSRFSDAEFREFLSTQIKRREPGSANCDAFTALMDAFPEETSGFMNPPEGMTLLDDHTISIKLPERMRRPEDEPYANQTATFKITKNNEIENEFREKRNLFYNSIYNGGRPL